MKEFLRRHMRGELFTASYSFAAVALIKLASSIITTRLLYPEAYGIVSMIAAIAFVLEMMSDLGAMTLMVRHPKAEEAAYINTAWTLKLIRGLVNASLLMLAAPWLAAFYETPALEPALRLYALCFVIDGFESMAFMLAIRRQRSSVFNLCELLAVAVTTAASVGLALVLRNHYAIVIGMIVHRLLMTTASHLLYREHRPRLQIDRAAAAELLQITKFVLPASILTLLMTQYDKAVFLKLFDLRLLGLYGLAMGIAQIVDQRVVRLARTVLFPRCAEAFRQDPAGVREVYYRGNARYHALALGVPAALGGIAPALVTVAFDPRYEYAGFILQLLGVRSVLISLASSSEVVLTAVGHVKLHMVANLARLAWLVMASLAGYWLGGFEGFLYGVASEPLGALAVYLAAQRRERLVDAAHELMRWGYAAAIFAVVLGVAELVLRGVTLLH